MFPIPRDDGRNTCRVPLAISWKASRDSTRETKNGRSACERVLPGIKDHPSRSDIVRLDETHGRGHDGPLLLFAYPPYEWSGSNPPCPPPLCIVTLSTPFSAPS